VEFIPYSCQSLDDDDITAVTEALKSPFITQGPRVDSFERAIEKDCKANHAIAVSSCTSALHSSYEAIGINENSTVWTSPITFASTANSILFCGAKVDFVDIDLATGNICLNALEEKLKKASKKNSLPDCVVPIHFSGRTIDIESLGELASKYEFKIVEDAAHALGACYKNGEPVGSSSISSAAAFSFHAVKSISTGEGGCVTTHSNDLAKKIRNFRTHGITRDPNELSDSKQPEYYYEQQSLGNNYRLTDFQAALGESQLKKLSIFIKKRKLLAKRYSQIINYKSITLPPECDKSAWHIYVIQLANKNVRDSVYREMRKNKIGVNVHYLPVYKHPFYQNIGFKGFTCSNAEEYYSKSLSIPLHQKLTEVQQDYVVKILQESLK